MSEDRKTPRIAIFGATSDIAVAFARDYAAKSARFALIARNQEQLDSLANDLRVRGAGDVAMINADCSDPVSGVKAANHAWSTLDVMDIAILAYGLLPDQSAAQTDPEAAEVALRVNFTSQVPICEAVVAKMEDRGSGSLVVITSVAGDRGRQSNYIYGSAKGGMQVYLDGLRHRLAKTAVQVLDIRPGFVSTKMTSHLAGKGPLWASPETVAADMAKAIETKRAIVYTPWFWRWIMFIVRQVPRPIFHRTKF